MTDGTTAPERAHEDLERTVHELRADLEHLRRELATEVRTRRVVVVDDNGFERVKLLANGSYGEVQVNSRVRDTCVTLEAHDEPDTAYVYLGGGGNGYGLFQVLENQDHPGKYEGSLDIHNGNETPTRTTTVDLRGVTAPTATNRSSLAVGDPPAKAQHRASGPLLSTQEELERTQGELHNTYTALKNIVGAANVALDNTVDVWEHS